MPEIRLDFKGLIVANTLAYSSGARRSGSSCSRRGRPRTAPELALPAGRGCGRRGRQHVWSVGPWPGAQSTSYRRSNTHRRKLVRTEGPSWCSY